MSKKETSAPAKSWLDWPWLPAVLAILLLATVAILDWLPGSATSSSGQDQAVLVEMTPNGFSETEITIAQGHTIRWQNNDTDFRWPASNVHPNHDEYPEFDPLEPIPPGESWDFTFDQVGEWEFHDHLKPYFVGTVTVTE